MQALAQNSGPEYRQAASVVGNKLAKGVYVNPLFEYLELLQK